MQHAEANSGSFVNEYCWKANALYYIAEQNSQPL